MSFRSTALLMLVAACSVTPALAQQPTIRWAPDLETARQAAAQFQVPVMVHFYGDNCLPCDMLEQRVLSQAEVVDTLNKYFICVKINATEPEGRAIAAEQFQVHSWPTDVFLSPDAKNLFQGVSPQDLPTYLNVLQNVAVRNRDRNLMLAARQNNPGLQSQQVAAPNMPASASAGASAAQGTTPANATQQSSLYAQVNQHTPPSMQVTTQQLAAARAAQGQVASISRTHQDPYMRPEGTTQQPAIGPSQAPSVGVQSGPLTQALQPTSIAGAVQGAEQQVLATALPVSNMAGPDNLPPRNQVAQVASPNGEPNFSQGNTGSLPPRNQHKNAMAQYSSMPTMTTAARPVQENLPKVETAAAQLNNTSPHDVENPYFDATNTGSGGSPSANPVNLYRRQQVAQQNMQAQAPVQQQVMNPQQVNPHLAGMTAAPTASPGVPAVGQPSSVPPLPSNTQIPMQTQAVTPSAPANYPAYATTSTNMPAAQQMQPTTAGQPTAQTPAAQTSMPTFQPRAAQPTSTAPKMDLASAAINTPNIATNVAQPTTASTAPSSPTLTQPVSENLALEGYCPVALQADSQWVDGKPEFSVRHRGKVYWLSSQDALQKFMANPDASSPVLSGYDPYALVEEGRMVQGNIKFGLHDVTSGKYMLFSSAEAKQKFWEDFDRYSLALSALIQRSNEAR